MVPVPVLKLTMPPRTNSSISEAAAGVHAGRVSVLLQAVQTCLRHSVESGASNVALSRDQGRCLVEVRDDGRGIAAAVLLGSGSSSRSAATHLQASLAATSQDCWLTVTSKSRQSFETCCWSCNKGQVVRQGLADEQQAKAGTLVSLR